ncbi:TPA: peptidase domain-containing ABC transporter, partial [Staphylococcus aureus]|nr:peptidase domain-containing ABC transporter [Staphylococcus aureus]
MSKIRYISQTQETECGLCCIAMILNYFGCDILPREMKESKDIGRDGLSLQQIKNIFNNYKVDVDIYEAGINRLPEILGTPVILYWDNSHFVILKKIVKNKYFITDPAIGDCILSKEQFSEKYSNLTLVSSPQKNFEKILNKRSNF